MLRELNEEILEKVIKLVINEFNPPQKLVSDNIKTIRWKVYEFISPLTDINPSIIRTPSCISPESRQLLQTIQCAFDLDPLNFYPIVQKVVQTLTSDSISNDITMYKYFIQKNWIWSQGFNSNELMMGWLKLEDYWVEKYIREHNLQNISIAYSRLDRTRDPIMIEIAKASDLIPKDTNSTNNPYVLIRYLGSTWISPISQPTLNPKFDFHVGLLLLDVDEPITISIWNRSSSNLRSDTSNTKDAFLGCVRLPRREINKIIDTGIISRPLTKRSKKSHVSGIITFQINRMSLESTDNDSIVAYSFQHIPSNPINSFRTLLQTLYEWDFVRMHQGKREPSPSTEKILSCAFEFWRIRPIFRSICKLETLISIFSRGFINIDSIYPVFLNVLEMVSEIDLPTANEVVYFIETSQRLLTLLNARLREFFVLVSSESPSHQSKKISSTQLDAIVNITASIYACPIFVRRGLSVDILKHIQVELLESLQSRYHGHVGISTTKNGPADVALITLTDLICKDLMIYHTEFDILLHGAIHIPTLAAWAFYKPLSIQLDEFSRTFKALSSDMSIVFDLYKSVRKLQKVCEQIDFKLADQFPMVEWFIHFVTEWLSYTETKVCDWVKAALDHDNYEKLSAFALHSSSVLDLFTSFQQLIDFIKELDWPNESESRRFYFEIFYDITNAIDRYAGLSKDFMVKELALKKSLQPPPPPKKAQFGKIKVTIPKRIRKKQPIANPEETRISTKACVMLLNIRAIPERLRALSSQVPNINDPVNINVVDKRLFGSNRFLYTLSILNANLQPIRPWNTKLSIRVSNKVGKDLGSTEPILQGTDIAWNSKLYGISHYTINSLVVSLVHHLEGQSPSLFAMGTLSLLPLQRNGIHEENVQLAQYGFVKIRLQVLDYDMNHFNELTELYTGIAEKKLIGLMVDQLSFDFRERIHPLALKYKTNGVKKFFKELDNNLTASEVSDIEDHLEPLFDFLNSNLEVMMATLGETIAFEVVLGVWNQLVDHAEAMIVPSLGDDPKDRKQWDIRRFNFFLKFMEIATEFFVVDGEGLDVETLETPSYQSLKSIMENYFKTKSELQEEYLALEDRSDANWMLKLIKMKGGKDFVDDMLRTLIQT